ncbi:hypothetical protein CRG98_041212 [Punica granatum]|uniref:Uncharacterized protein n=1 Tax=Punica granatum TaxID=22663 RepID=A0A2I0I387_PUNGR|nr:hypothetical protein CRG98_041212 [Punica granatum]
MFLAKNNINLRAATGAHPNFVSSGYACARLCNAAWEYPPSRGRATDAREKESPLAILRPEGRGPASYPGLGVRGTPKMLRQWSVRNRKFRIRGFYYVWAYIPHALSVLLTC